MITLLLQYWNRKKDLFVNYIISFRAYSFYFGIYAITQGFVVKEVFQVTSTDICLVRFFLTFYAGFYNSHRTNCMKWPALHVRPSPAWIFLIWLAATWRKQNIVLLAWNYLNNVSSPDILQKSVLYDNAAFSSWSCLTGPLVEKTAFSHS